jgi:gamma-glutamylcyclotransferase (GGCT)/AIG2-like uncharacterized protein YtfP
MSNSNPPKSPPLDIDTILWNLYNLTPKQLSTAVPDAKQAILTEVRTAELRADRLARIDELENLDVYVGAPAIKQTIKERLAQLDQELSGLESKEQ